MFNVLLANSDHMMERQMDRHLQIACNCRSYVLIGLVLGSTTQILTFKNKKKNEKV